MIDLWMKIFNCNLYFLTLEAKVKSKVIRRFEAIVRIHETLPKSLIAYRLPFPICSQFSVYPGSTPDRNCTGDSSILFCVYVRNF